METTISTSPDPVFSHSARRQSKCCSTIFQPSRARFCEIFRRFGLRYRTWDINVSSTFADRSMRRRITKFVEFENFGLLKPRHLSPTARMRRTMLVIIQYCSETSPGSRFNFKFGLTRLTEFLTVLCRFASRACATLCKASTGHVCQLWNACLNSDAK